MDRQSASETPDDQQQHLETPVTQVTPEAPHTSCQLSSLPPTSKQQSNRPTRLQGLVDMATTKPLTPDELMSIPPHITPAIEWQGRRRSFVELQTAGKGKRLLYLFSGVQRDWDAVQLGQAIGTNVHAVDLERDHTHDIADHHVWEDIKRSVASLHYDGVLMSPPPAAHTHRSDRFQAARPS